MSAGELQYCFTIRARVAPPVRVGNAGGAGGTGLHFAAITGGTVSGPALDGLEPASPALDGTDGSAPAGTDGSAEPGRVLPGGGDWWVDRGVTTQLDARYLIELGGHAVEVVNRGYWRPNAAAIAAMEAGREPAPEDLYYRTAPVFQTAAPELAWLTESVFVGYAAGELDESGEPATVVIRVYRVL